MDDEAGISQDDKAFLTRDRRERRRILEIYNKEESDFDTKAEWDAYLEEREDVIFNLVERIDVEATEKKVRLYQVANATNIQENVARKMRRQQDAAAAAAAKQDAPAKRDAPADGQAAAATDNTGKAANLAAAVPAATFAAYVPPGMAFASGPVTAMPVPIQNVEQNAEGRVIGKAITDKDSHDKMALASGWTDDVSNSRLLHDAFTTTLVF